MEHLEFESIESYFNDSFNPVVEAGPFAVDGRRLRLLRNKHMQLVIEAEKAGWAHESEPRSVPGSFVVPNEDVTLRFHPSLRATIKGLIHYGAKSNGKSGQMRTVERYGLHRIDLEFQHATGECSHLIEWIDNLPSGLVWPHNVRTEIDSRSNKTIEWDSGAFRLQSTSEMRGGAWAALHMCFDSVDMAVVFNNSRKKKREKSGFIVYRGCADEALRDRVRDTLSFALGRPIIYLGCTEFNASWYPLRARAVNPLTMNGAAFRMHTLPPFPIQQGNMQNVISAEKIEKVCAAILQSYDKMNFQFVSWAYWYAMCSPYHIEAAHFGAIIEHVQQLDMTKEVASLDRGLMPKSDWKLLRYKLLGVIDDVHLDKDIKDMLLNNIGRLNQAPQKLVLTRLLTELNLAFTDVEIEAWDRRNGAAHGTLATDHRRSLLDGKVLRMTVHRLIAGLTRCSDMYIDYYSLHFPHRPLKVSMPRRDDHPSKKEWAQRAPSPQ